MTRRGGRTRLYLAAGLFLGACGGAPNTSGGGQSEASSPEEQQVLPESVAAVTVSADAEPGQERVPLSFPHIVEPACPGEGCMYGEWLACDSLPLRSEPDAEAQVVGHVAPGSTFVVVSGAVVIDSPTVVAVTRTTRQVSFIEDSRTFGPGDTLYVLDYLGEGFFNALVGDTILEVEVFWPWAAYYPSDDFVYGGEVTREGASGFWVRTDGATTSSSSWLRADQGDVAAPSALDPDPPFCPAR